MSCSVFVRFTFPCFLHSGKVNNLKKIQTPSGNLIVQNLPNFMNLYSMGTDFHTRRIDILMKCSKIRSQITTKKIVIPTNRKSFSQSSSKQIAISKSELLYCFINVIVCFSFCHAELFIHTFHFILLHNIMIKPRFIRF